MLQSSFALLVTLSLNAHYYVHLTQVTKSQFEFSDQARAALCPFVGTEGMQCFDGELIKHSGKQLDTENTNLPRGVGISVDRTTGLLKAVAVQLTYSSETGRTWTDGFTGETFDIYNEAILSTASRVASAYNMSRIQIFRNASEFNAVWQQTFVDGKIRGGLLAQAPDLFKYMNNFTKYENALVLSQSIAALYILTMNPSTTHLNSFALNALSKLTPTFDPNLYEDFVDKWGTHIITKSLIGGMIEEQATLSQCVHGGEHNLIIQCLPFEDRYLSNSACNDCCNRNTLISKRRLGGNVHANSNYEWKRTLSFAPALLQILDMVPWYRFATDESIKKNLRTIIGYREKFMKLRQAEGIRFVDAHQTPCTKVRLNLPANAQWEQLGITVAGGHGQGGNHNQLSIPHSVFVDDEDDQTLVIADRDNHRIVQWKKGASYGQVVAGGNGPGNRLDQLNYPADVLIDKKSNSLIISERDNKRVVRWSRRQGTTHGEIIIEDIYAWGLFMDEQRYLYISVIEKNEVRRYDVDRADKKGTLVAGGNGPGSGLNQLGMSFYIFVDRNQSIYVSDIGNHRIVRWDKGATQGIVVAGGQGAGSALTQLGTPEGIFVDTSSTVYVTERENNRVTRWLNGAKQGAVIVGGNGNGKAANQFNNPHGMSFDMYGNLYVVDWFNHRVQRFTRQ